MGKADLHVHTVYSHDGSSTIEDVLEHAAKRAELDVIAITDHNTIEGAVRAQRLGPRYGIEVIVGCEISTAQGHILAYFLKEPIPPRLSALETIRRVKAQGGICVVAHPLARGISSLKTQDIRELAVEPDVQGTLVGIEVINGTLLFRASNRRAGLMCAQVGLAPVGSSDSHVSWTVGHAITEFPGFAIPDLRIALERGTTKAVLIAKRRRANYYFSHIYRHILRRLGWIAWREGPYGPYTYRRLAEVYETRY
ncbi:MAG: PHP domain-containing protein [Anaerolineales bacterium]|nr:PHP domain-containing protein [Anaerolineales bacterium]